MLKFWICVIGCDLVVLLFWICVMGMRFSLLDMCDGMLSINIYVCGFNLLLCVMTLSKFCQIVVHVLVQMLMKYNGKQKYIHKVLKK